MDQYQPRITVNRLHRMRPSDIEYIRASLDNPDFVGDIVRRFADYLARLSHPPTAVELDDVTRITLQLSDAGLWDRHDPADFLRNFRTTMDHAAQTTISDALGLGSGAAAAAYAVGAE